MNFWEYVKEKLGYELIAFDDGEGSMEGFDLIIEILYNKLKELAEVED